MTLSQTPTYNIKVVLNKTGITADTLRAWERRYGLPTPQRTSGGHRLYSEHDIATIQWLINRQGEGLSISRAVDLWNEQIASGSDPLAGTVSIALIPHQTLPTGIESTTTSLRAKWIEACAEFDETTAEQILNQAFSLFPIESVCADILQKGLSEIGELWYQNKLSVQQEHFASGLATRRLSALFSATPAPSQKETIIIGCPTNEWHTFTPLLLSLLLRRRGYKVIYLGADVPAVQFTDTVKDVDANLVILVAHQLTTAATLQYTALTLANKKIPVAFGGRIFTLHPSLRERIPGYFLGNQLHNATEEIERALSAKPKAPKVTTQSCVTAHQAYTQHRIKIEAGVREMLPPSAISTEDLTVGLHFISNQVIAALQLGDMSYVSAEIDWVQTLLPLHAKQPKQLIHFIDAYARSVSKNIKEQGSPILEWLEAEMQKIKT